MDASESRKVALALGGGSARGLANIGVLKVLERHQIPIDLLIGSSMGGLIAASYSIGTSPEEMEQLAIKFRVKEIMDITVPRVAILKGKNMVKWIEKLTKHKSFDDCRIPLAITATNIENGDELIFTSGDLQKIVKASCSWPGFFPPVKIDDTYLCDGGIRNSIPAKWAKKLGATFTIAVKVGFAPQTINVDNIFQNIAQSIQIMGEELDKYQSMQADIVIEPDLAKINQFGFEKAKKIIQIGESATERVIENIKSLLRI